MTMNLDTHLRGSFATAPRACAIAALLLIAPAIASAQAAAATTDPSVSQAEQRIREYQQKTTDVNKARARAALAELDADIKALEELSSHAPDEASRRDFSIRLESLKERRNDLRADYNQARLDELRSDARGEWNRFKGWVTGRGSDSNEREIGAPEPDPQATIGAPDDPARRASPASDRDAAMAADRATPAAADPAGETRRQLALDRLDHELEFLERLGPQLSGSNQQRFRARFEVLEARRSALDERFTTQRYDELMQDIHREIDRSMAAAE